MAGCRIRNSSPASAVGVQELMFLVRTQGRSEFNHFETLITASAIYWIISLVFAPIRSRIEAYQGKGDVR